MKPIITLRPVTAEDLPLMEGWLRAPQVTRWWGDNHAEELEGIRSGVAAGGERGLYWIAALDEWPYGFIQGYEISDEDGYLGELTSAGVEVPAGAWSIDYLIGEPEALGRGLASAMIHVACDVLASQGVDGLLVPVNADNESSWRALGRAGFQRLAGEYEMEPDAPGHSRRHVVYWRDLREEVGGATSTNSGHGIGSTEAGLILLPTVEGHSITSAMVAEALEDDLPE
ncbi:MAG: GNAT family N-acetyltransferase [Propionibacteriaceae bacterium]|nr:GNAT family N-acetyltransferase [Propionibacteriaceae bacterium]